MENEFEKIWDRNYQKSDDSIQKTLIELKKNGCTQISAIKIIVEKLNISLAEADKIVLDSIAWMKEKDDTLKIRKDFEEMI